MKIEGKVVQKIAQSGPKAKEIFADAMRDASTDVMEETIRQAPASTGNLRKAIRRELSESGLHAEIFPSVQYGEALHGDFDSSETFSPPRTIPAREAQAGGTLYRWAKKKGMNPWAVRASIKKKGVRYNRYMKRASANTESSVKKIFEGAIEKFARHLSD